MDNIAHRRWKVSDWQEMFDAIYGHRKVAGEVFIWFRLLEEIGEITRETRYKNREGIKYHLPDVFAWTCAFCSLRGFRISQLVVDRYNEGCPWCKNPRCVCAPGKIAYAVDKPLTKSKKVAEKKGSHEPTMFDKSEWTLGDWESELTKIYGERNDPLDWLQVAARLTEQAGYVAKVIRQRQDVQILKNALADVFAWTVGLFNSVKATGLTGDVQFADFVFDKYPNWCPKCHNRPCKCPAPVVRVFISSVMKETADERILVRRVLEEQRFIPLMFEDFKGQFFFDQEAEALKHLQESDLLLLILDNSLTSPVYTEFYTAVSWGKPVLIFLRERVDPVSPELKEFLSNVGRQYKYERFRDGDDLEFKLLQELKRLRE